MKTYLSVTFFDTYSGAEFPPSPLKLVQAIIASSQDAYLDVLNAFETQTPRIHVAPFASEYRVERYVINNDSYKERVNAQGKKPKAEREMAVAQLDVFEHANAGVKKYEVVRTFDTSASAHVIYECEFADALMPSVHEAIAKVHTLGRAGDWCLASAQDAMPSGRFDVYEAQEGGATVLRAPMQGSVASLFAHYAFDKVPVVYRDVAYAKNPPKRLPRALFELTEAVDMKDASVVVEEIRRAGIKANLKNAAGHDLQAPRLLIYPIPTTEHNHNIIKRVVISSTDAALVKEAVSKLAATKVGNGYLMLTEHGPVFSNYTTTAKVWKSVTPVLQSGYHNGDAKKKAKVYAKMFADAGLPTPVRIREVRGAVDFAVSAKHGHEKLPRIHLIAEFAEEVSGVVAVGTGRYSGLGVFAAL